MRTGVSWSGLGVKGVGSRVWSFPGSTPAPLGSFQQDTTQYAPKVGLSLWNKKNKAPTSDLFPLPRDQLCRGTIFSTNAQHSQPIS